eukprot:gnl/Spiro4/2510_TR1211_c0_g1_i1.p1 gnl/Spiro4/2510_TR1211_c0_g1~~gnl/Spiro4/2510_TR1211_c0_g1_i1.p1  ORF type:complete len:157 (-),score=37.06 gnl/Spiro4/2510_TR1211_c0_g1_i1:85-516(-)
MAFRQLFGVDHLQGKNGNVGIDTLEGKIVFVYFSAHWCPPCRGFTPVLSAFYEQVASKNAEIVFVSSDSDQSSFDGYYAEHPWLALPFELRDVKNTLCSKFGISGIPCLLVFGPDGKLLTNEGRRLVMNDRNGSQFPWPELGL